MKSVGIKVWVLTGDKIETAINIGFSAGLLDNSMVDAQIVGVDRSDIATELEEAQKAFFDCEFGVKSAMILAGDSLIEIAKDPVLLKLMLEISDKADVVVACRVSPK